MAEVYPAPNGAKCPECGADLTGQDVRKHSRTHWPDRMSDEPSTAEARKRQKALYDMGKLEVRE